MDTQKTIPAKPCFVKTLKEDNWQQASATARRINPANAPAIHQFMQLTRGEGLSPERLSILTARFWGAGGVHLTVTFMDDPEQELKDRILSHMNSWGEFANVSFTEVGEQAQVRISRTLGGGYWSYLGTDILEIPEGEPTMNLDSFSMETEEAEFHRVVRHETGHTLGFPHEHMREEIIADIDEEKAITFFMHTQGWSRQEVIDQVLTPLKASAIKATVHADPESIMCYWLPGSIMRNGKDISGGVDIDAQDKAFAALIYPKTLRTAAI